MCIKSEFKEICLKLATNDRSDKGFLLTSKICPQWVFIKNVYKIRFQRDHFETCNIWAKRKGLSIVIKILLSPAFSKKSGGTLFSAFRSAWFRIFSRYLVPSTPPTVFGQSFWNFTGAFAMVWRFACGFFRILKSFFITFFAFLT